MRDLSTVILTCNTGEGHNSASAAIKEVYDKHGRECLIADTLSFLSEKTSKFICNWHTRIYRYIPKAFTRGYGFAEGHPALFEEKSAIYKMITSGAEKLYNYIIENECDTVICAHVFSSLLMSSVVKKFDPDVVSCFVATDYTCSPSTARNLDLYFIPDKSITGEYEDNGIPKEKIIPVGIPVRQKFLTETPRDAARETAGIPQGKAHILMMCGSMGCGPMDDLTADVSRTTRGNAVVTVVCGTNKRLYAKLTRRFENDKNVKILGYVNSVPDLMDSADLFLTKPGGVSVSEAAAKCLPMVFVDAVAGCERHNMRFYLERGMAVTADTPQALADKCGELLSNGEELARMRENIKNCRKDDPAEHIFAVLQDYSAAEALGGSRILAAKRAE